MLMDKEELYFLIFGEIQRIISGLAVGMGFFTISMEKSGQIIVFLILSG